MDGTLLNTEDIYTEAASQLLARYGKGPLTWDIKLQLQGLPGPEALKRVVSHFDIPITPEEFMAQGFAIQETLWHKSDFLPGALELVQYLVEKDVPIALGTSSNKLNFTRKSGHLQHGFELFGQHIVTGDDSRIAPGRGKPNPDIWHVCLDSLNNGRKEKGLEPIEIEECLIFEDGIPGVISGKNANAHVIWIPHPEALEELNGKEKTILGDGGEIITTLLEFDREKYGL